MSEHPIGGATGRSTRKSSKRDAGQRQEAPGSGAAPAERVVAALSALLVAAIIGYTLREGLSEEPGAPILSVHADSVVPTPTGHLLMFTVRNEGTETAAAVQVQGELLSEGKPVEESHATLDYVPEAATRRGALQFRRDPAEHRLDVRVVGFEFP